ncbi:MAG: 3'(2'),5'-bisphosphate nucleotidase CysQ [Ahrensia sp.]
MDLSKLAGDLQPVMRAAGDEILRIYDLGPDADFKEDGTPVCAADRAADRIILAALADLAPDIAVVSEENAASHAMTPPERFFLVDPLDGTKEFLKRDGKGAYTVNIALIEHGAPIMGLVYAPALDRLFVGVVGEGAQEIAGGSTTAITCRSRPASPVAVASASHRDPQTDQWLADNRIAKTISIGSSLKFCLVAAGEADLYPRFGPTMEWDTAAGDAVLRAAGGQVTNPDGSLMVYGKADYRNGAFIASGAA